MSKNPHENRPMREIRIQNVPQQIHDDLNAISDKMGVPLGALMKVELSGWRDKHSHLLPPATAKV